MPIGRLTRVAQIRGVDVYVHWSIFAIGILILVGAVRRPALSMIGLAVRRNRETGELLRYR
jgi:hypothetical protein